MSKPILPSETKIGMTAHAIIHELELAISEAFVGTHDETVDSTTNVFGRQVIHYPIQQIDALEGLTITGLRTAALIQEEDILRHIQLLYNLARLHLPGIIHVSRFAGRSDGRSSTIGQIQSLLPEESGYFLFESSTPQEVIDFTLIAHRLAESALMPGVHLIGTDRDFTTNPDVQFPAKEELIRFLGNPDDRIECPTPAQKMIFGKYRRRVFDWFNCDEPAMKGVLKDTRELELENAARQCFFQHHIPDIAENIFKEFEGIFNRKYSGIDEYRSDKADYLLLVGGDIYQEVKRIIGEFKIKNRAKIACFKLNLVNPIPQKEINNILEKKKGLTILGPIHEADQAGNTPLVLKLKNLSNHTKGTLAIYSALYGSVPERKRVEAAILNMLSREKKISPYYLNIDFNQESHFPKQEILIQSLQRDYPDIKNKSLPGTSKSDRQKQEKNQELQNLSLPQLIRKYADGGPPYSRLSRFYENIGTFYQSDKTEEIVADPFQAIQILPPNTAYFSALPFERKQFPIFNPSACTGCGDCFVACPHSALPATVIHPKSLIRGAMEIASKQNRPVPQLTPLVNSLAKAMNEEIKKGCIERNVMYDILRNAFKEFITKSRMEEEKLLKVQDGLNTIEEILTNFPITVTDTFFHDFEKTEKNSGLIFSIAVDPIACTACNLCVELCPENALEMALQSADILNHAQQTYQLWEQLPDTETTLVSKMIEDKNYNSFAANFLKRDNYLSIAGANPVEEMDASKTAVHLLAAVANSIHKKKGQKIKSEVDELIESLSENIHQILSNSLPKGNYEHLTEVINASHEIRLSFDQLVHSLNQKEHLKLIDSPSLQRKLILLNDLKEFSWALNSGSTGYGRSSYNLAIRSEEFDWGNRYPYNLFNVPVLVLNGQETSAVYLGLMDGLKRHLLDNIKLLRRARLEVKNKFKLEIDGREIAGLRWGDLSHDERSFLPPLIVLWDKSTIADESSRSLISLLSSDLPIKISILDDGKIIPGTTPGQLLSGNISTVISAISGQNAFLYQGSLDFSDRLYSGFEDGLEYNGPSLFYIYMNNLFDQANINLANQCRVQPNIRYTPWSERIFISQKLDLSGNPSINDRFVFTELIYEEEGDQKFLKYGLSFADWAFHQNGWETEFAIFQSEDKIASCIDEYISLDEHQIKSRLPVICTVNPENKLERYVVSELVMNYCRKSMKNWDILRELGGLSSPYPLKLKDQIETELRQEYKNIIDKLKSEHEEKLNHKEKQIMAKVKLRLKKKLIDLSNRAKTVKN